MTLCSEMTYMAKKIRKNGIWFNYLKSLEIIIRKSRNQVGQQISGSILRMFHRSFGLVQLSIVLWTACLLSKGQGHYTWRLPCNILRGLLTIGSCHSGHCNLNCWGWSLAPIGNLGTGQQVLWPLKDFLPSGVFFISTLSLPPTILGMQVPLKLFTFIPYPCPGLHFTFSFCIST